MMKKIIVRDEYIKLGQVLKAAGLAGSGAEAKMIISAGQVFVNGNVEYQRGKKLRNGDRIEYQGETILICE